MLLLITKTDEMLRYVLCRSGILSFLEMVFSDFKSLSRVMRKLVTNKAGPEVLKLFSCSTQLSTKVQLLIKTKIPTNKEVLALTCLSVSDVVFIMLINIKMPTVVGILTFMSGINFMLS